MAVNYILNVPKLKGRENYDEWAFAAENFLILEGVNVTEDSEHGGDITSVDEQKAKAKLIMTIDPSLYVHIKSEKTVQSMWKKIKSLFDDTGFTRRISLLRNLISIRLDNCETVTAYVTQPFDTAQKLRGTGFDNISWTRLDKNKVNEHIMVLMESVVSGHKFNSIRERLGDKLELIRYDPYIQHESLYKERKKIRSIKKN